MDMQTRNADASTADAGNPISVTDLEVAARYLERAAVALRSAEAAPNPYARLTSLEVSRRLAQHAVAIVLGEKSAEDHP